MQNKNEHNNFKIQEEAPFLSNIKRQNNFKTKNKYFDDLPNILSDKVLLDNKSSIWSKFKFNIAIPSISIILIGWFAFNNLNTQESINIGVSSSEFYTEMISDENGLEMALLFEEPKTSFAEFVYIEEEKFNFELPIETDDLELNILFN